MGMCDHPRGVPFFTKQEINPYDFQDPKFKPEATYSFDSTMNSNNYDNSNSNQNESDNDQEQTFNDYSYQTSQSRYSFIPQSCPNQRKFSSKINHSDHKKSVFNKNGYNVFSQSHNHNININENKSDSMSPQFQSNQFSNNMNNGDGEENKSKQQHIIINDINDINNIDIDEIKQENLKKKEVDNMENVKANIIKNKKNQ